MEMAMATRIQMSTPNLINAHSPPLSSELELHFLEPPLLKQIVPVMLAELGCVEEPMTNLGKKMMVVECELAEEDPDVEREFQ